MIKEKFEELLSTFCEDTPNISGILSYLADTDFYTAPASTKYHGCHKGGLCEHSIQVFYNLLNIVENVYKCKPCAQEILNNKQPKIYTIPENLQSIESTVEYIECCTPYHVSQLAFVALLHDVCKIGCYVLDTKNQKNEQGQWEKVNYYRWEESIVMGHGSKSLWLLQCMTSVPLMEAQAIRYHMGFCEANGSSSIMGEVSKVFDSNELALLLHQADLQSTYINKI